ncbi:MAG: DUF4338 domain-containing protein [Deltaproteobacteria bacterium]|nr:DUF4338 domain-containing protein [Deltaproteobacteria bacterium]
MHLLTTHLLLADLKTRGLDLAPGTVTGGLLSKPTVFLGTCYKVADRIHAGQTKGRGKLEVHQTFSLPVKDIWLSPLEHSFKQALCTT